MPDNKYCYPGSEVPELEGGFSLQLKDGKEMNIINSIICADDMNIFCAESQKRWEDNRNADI